MTSNKQIRDIASKLINDAYDYQYIGIRVQKESSERIGETISHVSSVWEDGEELAEKLYGVCAIDISRVRELSGDYDGYMGEAILILGSNYAECGNDAAEIIMRGPVVLDIIRH